MILCDTSALIEFFRQADTPVARRLDQAMQDDDIIVGDLILIEILQGIRFDGERETIAGIMQRFDFRHYAARRSPLTRQKIIDVCASAA